MASVALDVRAGAKAGRPAGPSTWKRLLTGEAWRQNGAEFTRTAAQTYGDLVYVRVFGKDFYFLNHPDLVRDLFLKDAPNHHRNNVMQTARQVLGHGLLTSEEPLHMRQRRLAQPAFLRERIAAYGEVIGAKTLAMTTHWQSGTELDLHAEMMELALRIVGKCLFDVDELQDVDAMAEAVTAFMVFMPLSFVPFPELVQKLPIPAMTRLRRGKAHLDELIYRMIAERRADPVDRGDLLSMLLRATDSEGETAPVSMTDQQLRDECVTVILAGHETTANALSFALHLLAHHPEVQERLHAEAVAVLGGRSPVAADYPQLAYATQVFAEAMRLYPPVWVTGRTCAVSYGIAGYTIPVGATLLAPQYAIQRDPRFFAEPDQFNPERFTPERKAAMQKYTYFPFAGGSRQCIAEGLAWMEGTLALAVIARNWKLTPRAGSAAVPEIEPAVSLRPKRGVWLTVRRR